MSDDAAALTPGAHVAGTLRWAGIRYAEAGRLEPPRRLHGLPRVAGLPGPAPLQPVPYYEDPGAPLAEDCLNLTVWAPQHPAGPSLPVVVWIYGGGFEHGSCAALTSDASALAATGQVVSVSLNYRLGVLGFLSLSHLDGFPGASNLGLRDVVAGLAWVREHVAALGGDPSQVTVVGESAGAFLAGALPAVDSAAGLYSRLVLFSGGASRVVPAWRAREMTGAFLRSVGAEDRPAALRDMAAQDLLDAQPGIAVGDIGLRNSTAPQALGVVDDSAEPDGALAMHPMAALEVGRAGETPLLVCSVRDEISAFRRPEAFDPPSLDALVSEVSALGVDRERAQRIVAYYADGAPSPSGESAASPGLARQRLLTDWIYRLPAVRAALAQDRAGGTAHLAMTGRVGAEQAGHACDAVGLIGGHLPGSDDAVRARDQQVTSAVLAFATTGDPGWRAVRDEDAVPYTHVFGDEFDAARDYADMLALWEGVDRP